MGRNSVAVLDVRSSEVAVFFGERGVNRTFVFNGIKTEPYDGYQEGQFYNVRKLADAVIRAISAVEQMCGERIRTLYIGVPGEFIRVFPKEQNISFPKKRRIGAKEKDALFESGRTEEKDLRFIRATSMIYTTADNRRLVDPEGIVSTGLSGVLSYSYCTEYFAATMEEIFKGQKIELVYLPTPLAMATYLIPPETRDEYAFFLDVGIQSSTVLMMLGGGVLIQRTYWTGKGQVAAHIVEKFDVPYELALDLLSKANLYAKDEKGMFETVYRGKTYDISLPALIDTVKEGLDELCEGIYGFLDKCSERELDNKPLYVSAEGVCEIRGALEHMSRRLNRICEPIVPDLPYYNKPSMSSRVALLDMACDDRRKRGFLYRLLNGFGG